MTPEEIENLRTLCRSEFERINAAHAEIETDITRIELDVAKALSKVIAKHHRLSNDIPKAMEHMNQLIDALALQRREP